MKEIPTSTSAQRPEPKPFFVDSCAFGSGSQFEYAVLDIPESKVNDWPMIYILSNDEAQKAYVGQTTSVVRRMGQHGENVEKSVFDTATVIYHEEFNASAITDYEHRLIQLMSADGIYELTNKNEGMIASDYFSKAEYDQMFEDLWDELRTMEMAQHSIDEIEESEVFKYSPYKSLNADQRLALDEIMDAIKGNLDEAKPIVVQGKPGTGKTVLAVYLMKLLHDDPDFAGMNIRLVEPVLSLRKSLGEALGSVNGLSKSCVIGPSDVKNPKYGYEPGKKNFDILLVDEAHRLKRRVNLGLQFGNYDKVNEELGLPEDATQLDWILDQAKLPILFYDPLQSVGPSGVQEAAMREKLGESFDHPIRLESQMRVKGGDEYLNYVRAVLDGRDPKPRAFEGYDFVFHDDFAAFVDSFESTLAEHDLTRMVAGYAWKWKTKGKKNSSPEDVDILIDGIGLRWNCDNNNWVPMGFEDPQIAHEVGCIHSIQGYDLSWAYVIIGDDLRLDSATGLLEADSGNYFDANGKSTATPEELTAYIKNIYYVLLTRGIYGTHVYVHDPALREYFAKYFQVE